MRFMKVNKGTKRSTGAIIVGIILYLSKFLRPFFNNNPYILTILGFLPNFGLAFAIPFIYVVNRIRLNKPVRHFTIACIVTLVLMVLNEIRDRFQPGRVFDWYDICASVFGVASSFLLFHAKIKGVLADEGADQK